MHAYSSSDGRGGALGALATFSVVAAIGLNASVAATHPPSWVAWFVGAPTVAAAFGILYKALDSAGWKWRWVRRLGLSKTPIIDGVYEGTLISSYQNVTLPIRLTINQTWTELIVKMEVLGTTSSTSRSVAAALDRDGHAEARLTYTYKNAIRPGVAAADMRDHDGTADLVVHADSGDVDGRYFNARGRQGTMSLQRVVS
jgi:SMODS-associating 2TM, beta-strand rich effector domain